MVYWLVGMVVWYINVDIVMVFEWYCIVIGYGLLEEECGFVVLIEIVWLWFLFGYYDCYGVWYFDGVIGFDEYMVVVCDNVFMNLMVVYNLYIVVDVCLCYFEVVEVMGVIIEEMVVWCDVVDVVNIFYDEEFGVY